MQGSVNVLLKAGAILELLEQRSDLSAVEIAELAKEPRSTVYRLLGTLQQLGWVESAPSQGRYRLGVRLFQLGSAVARTFDVRTAAEEAMRQLHADTGETVFLLVPRGSNALCISEIGGRWVRSMAITVGTTLPLHIGAGPRALLAFQPEPFYQAYVAESLVEFTEDSLSNAADLEQNLEQIRREGVATSDGDVVPGMAAIGAPFFDHVPRLRGAISLSGPRPVVFQDGAEKVHERIIEAAKSISRRLGFESENSWPPCITR